jgi:hypothetical protein
MGRPHLFAANVVVNTETGDLFSFNEIRDWVGPQAAATRDTYMSGSISPWFEQSALGPSSSMMSI